jgi:hypothetical protein
MQRVPRITAQLAAKSVDFYRVHPVEFVEDIILQLTQEERATPRPFRRVEPEQVCILNALAGHKTLTEIGPDGKLQVTGVEYNSPEVMGGRRTASKSGHGIGKTVAECFAIPWFLSTRGKSKVLVTGPKYEQLKVTVWSSLSRFHAASRMAQAFECKTDTFQAKMNPMAWFAKILTARDQENLAGLHDEHLLVLVDEASAEVIDKMREALISLAAQKDNLILLLGNPTRTSGLFYDAFNAEKHLWYTMTFNSEHSAIFSEDQLSYYKTKYHEESDTYRVRVRGEFPRGDPRAIIALAECEAARMREVRAEGPVEIGVDPALEGNDLMAVCVRQGNHVFPLEVKPRTTPTDQIVWVTSVVQRTRLKLNYSDKIRVKVDAGGGYGAALIESLSLDTTNNIECIPIHNNATSSDPAYKYYATQAYFEFGRIISQVELPDDTDLISELAARQYQPTAGGLGMVKIEPKTDFKARFGSSPNRADALILAFAGGPKKVLEHPQITTEQFRAFEIDWDQRRVVDPNFDGCITVDADHLVGLVLTKNLTIVGLAAFYEPYRNKLWVYHEYKQDRPIMDVLVPTLRYHSRAGVYRDCRNPRIIGNEIMFRQDSDRRPFSDVLLRDGHLYVSEAYQYDEFGATSLGIQLFRDGRVTFHTDVKEARRDISLWSADGSRLSEDENPFCKALLLILSEVRHKQRSAPAPRAPVDYHPVGQQAPIWSGPGPDYRPNKRETSWMGR